MSPARDALAAQLLDSRETQQECLQALLDGREQLLHFQVKHLSCIRYLKQNPASMACVGHVSQQSMVLAPNADASELQMTGQQLHTVAVSQEAIKHASHAFLNASSILAW